MASSFWELLLVLAIVFVLFGAGKLPRVMADLGRGIRALRDGLKEDNQQKMSHNQEDKQ